MGYVSETLRRWVVSLLVSGVGCLPVVTIWFSVDCLIAAVRCIGSTFIYCVDI